MAVLQAIRHQALSPGWGVCQQLEDTMTQTPTVHNASPVLVVCTVPRATALQLVAPAARLALPISEALWEGLEQSYGEAEVWLGFSPAQAVDVFVDTCLTLGRGEGSPALGQFYTALRGALEGSWTDVLKAAQGDL